MRKIAEVINGILVLVPTQAPAGFEDNLTVMTAQLRIMARVAAYTPPESLSSADQWGELERLLYRYMPPPTAFDWANEIAVLVQGGIVRQPSTGAQAVQQVP